jgi:cytochrome c553
MSRIACIVSTALTLALTAAGCHPGSYDPGTGGDAGDGRDPDGQDPADAGGPGGGSAAAARALFDDTVAPTLEAKCVACHGGAGTSPLKFVPADANALYDTVTSYDRLVGSFDKASAPLLVRLVPGPHNGVSYTSDEAAALTTWLDAELSARRSGGGPPPPVTETPGQASARLISEWSGCMELAAWDAEGVASKWANLSSSEGPCIRCHVNGQANMIATDDSTHMFNVVASSPYFLLTFFSADVSEVASAKMVVNYDVFERVANSTPPFLEHPQFDTQNGAIAALERFYQKTLVRKAAGTCDPSRITP